MNTCSDRIKEFIMTEVNPDLQLTALDDDQLGLLFLTCHPSLPQDTRVALALKLVGGFSVGEIARAFLVPEKTIGTRPSGSSPVTTRMFGERPSRNPATISARWSAGNEQNGTFAAPSSGSSHE